MRCGVWAGRPQLRNPGKCLDLALSSGCSRVDLIVNDLSRWRVREGGKVYASRYARSRSHWKTYDRRKLLEFAKQATDRGMQVNTLFWMLPTPQSVEQGTDWLNEFAEAAGVHSHVLDCEEPITKSSFDAYGGDPEECARDLRQQLAGRLGVTMIGYAPAKIVRPFIELSDYAIPQTYLTTTSGLSAASVERLLRRAAETLKARELVGSFALYRQPKQDNIQTTIDALRRCGVREAVGWHASGLPKYGASLKGAIYDPEC